MSQNSHPSTPVYPPVLVEIGEKDISDFYKAYKKYETYATRARGINSTFIKISQKECIAPATWDLICMYELNTTSISVTDAEIETFLAKFCNKKDEFSYINLETAVKSELTVDLRETNARSRVLKYCASYHELLVRYGVEDIGTTHPAVKIRHLSSRLYPLTLREELQSDMVYKNTPLSPNFTLFYSHLTELTKKYIQVQLINQREAALPNAKLHVSNIAKPKNA